MLLISLLLLSSINYFFSIRRATNKSRISYQILAEQMLSNFAMRIDSYEGMIFNIYCNTALAHIINQPVKLNTLYENSYQKYAAATTELSKIVYSAPYVKNALVIDNYGQKYYYARSDAVNNETKILEILRSKAQLVAKSIGKAHWVGRDGSTYMIRNIYAVTPLLQRVGTIILEVDINNLIFSGFSSNNIDGWIVITNNNEEVISYFTDGKRDFDENIFLDSVRQNGSDKKEVNIRGEKHIYISHRPEDVEFSIYNIVPISIIQNDWIIIRHANVILSLISFVVALIFALYMANRFSSSIEIVVAGIKEIARGNFNSRIEYHSEDEIGVISQHINMLAEQIEDLLSQIVHEETEKQRIEYQMLQIKYSALQSQINPHFMYNSLETINSLAKISGNSQISDLVCRFSNLLRKNVRVQNKYISLSEEIEYIRDYLFIHESIYGKILRTFIYIDEGIDKFLVPSLILQPIVENSIVHNIRNNSEEIFINVRCYSENSNIIFEVEDNGRGFDPIVLDNIFDTYEDTNESNRQPKVGLKFVIKRLQLLYGDDSSFDIESKLGRGSLVRICIPKIEETK
jgi:two-component system sensor histidine kinase YesM